MPSVNLEQTLKQLQIKLIDSIDILENDGYQEFTNLLEEVKDTAKNIKLWGFYCFIEEILFFCNETKHKLDIKNSISLDRKKLLEVSLDSLLEYTKGISNGLYDIPIFYLVTLDLLRYNLGQESNKKFSLYTQSSFFLKSLEKNNISSFRCSFNEIQKMKIINSIEALEFLYDFDFTVRGYDYRKPIHSCLVLASEFKGTQHEVLWSLCHIIFSLIENDDFADLDRLFFTYLFNDIIRNYSNVLEDMTFVSIEKHINKILASLCYLLHKYNDRNFTDNLVKMKISSLIRMPQSNTLDSLIKFRNNIDFKEISVITLDFYSELDLAISSILENNKKKIDIADALETLVKQQNSFVVIGYYQYWFEYTNALAEMHFLTQKENFVESKKINKLKDILFDLLELVANLQKSENNMDNLPFCISTSSETNNFITKEKEVIEVEVVSQETFDTNSSVAIVPQNTSQLPANNIDTEKLKEMSDKFSKINNHILMLEKVVKQINIIQDSVDSAEVKNALNFISENAKEVHENIKKDMNSSSESFQKLYEEALDSEMENSIKSLLNSSKPTAKIRVLIFQLNKEQSHSDTDFYNLQKNSNQQIEFKITSNKSLLEEDIGSFKPNLIVFEVNKARGILIELFEAFNLVNFSREYPTIILGDDFNHKESQMIIENGASVYLQKPFEVSKFIKVINKLIKNKKQNLSGQRAYDSLEEISF